MHVAIIEDDFAIAQIMELKFKQIKEVKAVRVYNNPNLFFRDNFVPDFLFLDISLPEMNGLVALPIILKYHPDTNVVMHTIQEDPDVIFNALQLGAVGYIDKQSKVDSFKDVLKVIKQGGAYMTPSIALKIITYFRVEKKVIEKLTNREMEIAQGILDGLSYKLIADRHEISIDTVRMHIKNIYKKLNINSKGELFNLLK
jgi:DNA-binding NarL/FixJ family response regulator